MSTWKIDPAHTDVLFSAKHMMVTTVRGTFHSVDGTLDIDEQEPTRSSGEFRIAAASLNTGVAQRDGHLRSADFFDAEAFPKMTFRSRRIEETGKGRYRVVGDLTLRDATREATLEVEETGRGKDPWGKERIGYQARGAILRSEWGLKWNQALETGGVLVSDRVDLEVEVQVVQD